LEFKKLSDEKSSRDDEEISRCNNLISQNKALIKNLLEEVALLKVYCDFSALN